MSRIEGLEDKQVVVLGLRSWRVHMASFRPKTCFAMPQYYLQLMWPVNALNHYGAIEIYIQQTTIYDHNYSFKGIKGDGSSLVVLDSKERMEPKRKCCTTGKR